MLKYSWFFALDLKFILCWASATILRWGSVSIVETDGYNTNNRSLANNYFTMNDYLYYVKCSL